MRKAIDAKAQKLIDDKAAVDYRNNILLKERAIEKTLEKAQPKKTVMTSVYSARSGHTNRSMLSARSSKSANAAPPKISKHTTNFTSPQTISGSENKFLKKNVAKMFTQKKEEPSARTRMQEYQAGVLKTTQQK